MPLSPQTLVVIGCPVRKRNWILPEYLAHLKALHVPSDVRVRGLFLLNGDPQDVAQARELIYAGLGETATIQEIDFPEQWAEANNFSRLVFLRNQLKQAALNLGADYLFSVDSDILLPPRALEALLKHRVPMVAGLLNNHPQSPHYYPNGGRVELRTTERAEGGAVTTEIYLPDYNLVPNTGLHRVQVTGAAALIRSDALLAGEYGPHHSGEDYPFCKMLEEAGYDVWVDTDLWCEHRMIPPWGQHER